MKNFLKSTAIFACIAFLFCACSEDDTVAGKGVTIPVIESLYPGIGRAELSWVVPEDSGVNKCMIAWTNYDDVKYVTNIYVEEGDSVTYEILDLPTGTYTVTLQYGITSTGEFSTGVSEEVTTYDDDTYKGQWPTVGSYHSYDEETGITLLWDEAPEDFAAVQVTYWISEEEQKTSEILPFDEATLPDAIPASEFTIVPYFKPADGLDYATGYNEASPVYSFATRPTGTDTVYLEFGHERLIAHFYLTAENLEEIVSTNVSYTNEDNTGEGGKALVDLKAELGDSLEGWCSVEVTGIPAGTYQVDVYNVKEGGLHSEHYVTDTLTVYGASSFTMPTISTLDYNDNILTVTWDELPTHFAGVGVSYLTEEGETVTIESLDITETSNTSAWGGGTMVGSSFMIMATYCPENCLDSILVMDMSEIEVPTELPATPGDLLVQSGIDFENNMYGDAYIKLSWSLVDLSELYKSVIYYTLNGKTESIEVPVEDLVSGTNSYIMDGIDAMQTYSFHMINEREGDIVSYSTDTVEVYTYNLLSYETPTPSTMSSDGVMTVGWSDIDSDLRYVTATYNGESQTVYAEDGELPLVTFAAAANATGMTFQAAFMPDSGLDYVVLDGEDESVEVGDYDLIIKGNKAYIYTALGLKSFSYLISGNVADFIDDLKYQTDSTAYFDNSAPTSYSTTLDGLLMNDIDLSEVCSAELGDWDPIGTTSVSFSTTFDGGGHTISNLYIAKMNDTGTYGNIADDLTFYYQGLFGYLSSGTVKNFTLYNPKIIAFTQVGAVAGYATASYITNCHVKVSDNVVTQYGGLQELYDYLIADTVDATSIFDTRLSNLEFYGVYGNYSAGGIVGTATAISEITDCTNEAIITTQSSTSYTYGGTIVGVLSAASTMTGCEFSGFCYMKPHGGMAGNPNASTVIGCANHGYMRVSGVYAGGIGGYSQGAYPIITACYNDGLFHSNVSGTNPLIGGISGRSVNVTITGCYTTCPIYRGVTSGNHTVGYITGSLTGANEAGTSLAFSNFYIDYDYDHVQVATEGNEYKHGIYTVTYEDDWYQALSTTLEELNSVNYITMNNTLSSIGCEYYYVPGDTASGQGPQLVKK